MKQKLFIPILFAGLITVILFSCKKSLQADIPPANSEIAYEDNTDKNFYVLSSAPGDTYKIPIGITTPLSTPVTVQLSYTSATAVAGTHYTAPASITIPAGKVLDSISVKGFFANIPAGVTHRVVVRISGGDLPALSNRDSTVLLLRRYCNVNPAALAGNYNTVETSTSGTVGNYVKTVTNVVQTSPTTATGRINNIWDFSISANVIFDWTDPSNFKVSMNPLSQTTQYTSAGMAVLITQHTGTNTFSSCANTITMNFRLVRSDGGVFDTWRADMTRQ
jgi:hypothetical protein